MATSTQASRVQVTLGWASLALAVAKAMQEVEARTGNPVSIVELRSAPGRVVQLKVGVGDTIRETVAIEVSWLSPEEVVRAIPHTIAFLDTASSRPVRSHRGASRVTSRRRLSRAARRTSNARAYRRE